MLYFYANFLYNIYIIFQYIHLVLNLTQIVQLYLQLICNSYIRLISCEASSNCFKIYIKIHINSKRFVFEIILQISLCNSLLSVFRIRYSIVAKVADNKKQIKCYCNKKKRES